MIKQISFFTLVTFLVVSGFVSPGSATLIDVYASTAQTTNPQDTGIDVTAGQILTISSGLDDTWSLGPETPSSRTCNADGIPPSYYGQFTYGGFTANYGAMVGQIDAGSFFLVGSSYGPVNLSQSGRLYLVCWDSNYSDNSGLITANVNVIPIPASVLLLGSGLLGLGLLGWRRRQS